MIAGIVVVDVRETTVVRVATDEAVCLAVEILPSFVRFTMASLLLPLYFIRELHQRLNLS